MANIVFSADGKAEMMRLSVKALSTAPRGWQCRLFVNAVYPFRGTVLTDLLQASFVGYSPVTLIEAQWSDPLPTAGVCVSNYGPSGVLFTPTVATAQVVYGYYVTFAVGAKLLYAQALDGPRPLYANAPLVLPISMWGDGAFEPETPGG